MLVVARDWRLQVVASVVTAAFFGAAASAQTYYKWTDERGTVHLSDQPPPRGKAEERVLVPPRPAAPEVAETPAPAGTPEERREPAAVTIEKREVTRLGPNSVRVAGELQNTGGSPAERIAVVVKANDAVQGNPCLEREITPSTDRLAPREKASFEAELTDPCLFGDAPVELSVRWE
jgi:hypothetical protein